MDRAVLQADAGGRFRLQGRMDFDSVPALLDESLKRFADETDIRVDFSAVEMADSAGLALLVEWASWARREQRTLRFERLPEQLLALARISDVEKLLPIA